MLTRMSRLLLVCLFATLLSAATYEYRISGNGPVSEDRIVAVDTESEDFQLRLQWINETLDLSNPAIFHLQNREVVATLAGTIDSSAVPTGVRFGIVCWTKEITSCVDVGSIGVQPWGPTHVVVWLNFELGLGKNAENLGHLRYAVKKPAEPPKDWEAKDSPVGAPLPNQPGRFKSNSKGYKIGDTWTGPSGAVYKLTNIGGIFQYLAWVQQ